MSDPTATTEEKENAGSAANGSDYGSDSVQVLRDAAHIRRRPGVYIGDVGTNGLHHLAYELVYNSIDEALAGYCHNIHLKMNVDNSVTVSDDGRGIPVEEHPVEKKPVLEVVMTTVGAGAKFDKGAYKTSVGLNGMGAKAVTALSEWVEARIRRNGRLYVQEYERGFATTPVKDMGPSTATGTGIRFKPDPEIFRETAFNYDTFETHLRELAFLNKGVSIKLTEERTSKEEHFKYDGGIAEFVAYLNRNGM
jgi:DNA gyrase subunit B